MITTNDDNLIPTGEKNYYITTTIRANGETINHRMHCDKGTTEQEAEAIIQDMRDTVGEGFTGSILEIGDDHGLTTYNLSNVVSVKFQLGCFTN